MRTCGVIPLANISMSILCRRTVWSMSIISSRIFPASERKNNLRRLSSETVNDARRMSAAPVVSKRKGNNSCIAHSPL